MKIEEIFTKAWGWYKGLKTWKKGAYFLFLIVLAILGIIYAAYKTLSNNVAPAVPTEADDAHAAVVDNTVAISRAKQKKLEAELMIKKSEAMTEVQQRIVDAGKQRDIRDLISRAKSFEEVDQVLRGLKR